MAAEGWLNEISPNSEFYTSNKFTYHLESDKDEVE